MKRRLLIGLFIVLLGIGYVFMGTLNEQRNPGNDLYKTNLSK